jgi:altered-inheritance-of-mitochondria protein 13
VRRPCSFHRDLLSHCSRVRRSVFPPSPISCHTRTEPPTNHWQTDSSRAQTLELHIQARVAEELERIRARESQTLADLEKRLAKDSKDNGKTSNSQSPLSLDTPLVPFAGSGSLSEPVSSAAPEASGTAAKPLRSALVQQEIDALRAKLAERRKVREMDEGVKKAREEVVKCLTENERRPLDCWQEVEGFRREVARLERGWVERIVG